MEDSPVALGRVEDSLREWPTAFDFFQAVRLLERMRPGHRPVGYFGDPGAEAVRFSVPSTLAFPPSEIEALEVREGGQARMTVNFMGLTGPSGVLPHPYTELVAERDRAKDRGLHEFLDIFHHRVLSLFYRAWRKHHFVAGAERGEDPLREHLLDLAGVGLESFRRDLPFGENALVYYAGLLALPQRGPAALEQLLRGYFEVPVEIIPFGGGWHRLGMGDQCALGEPAPSTRLGQGAVVGDEIWDAQTRVRLRIGPLPRSGFDRFLPGGDAHAELSELARFFGHDHFDFELQVVLARDDVPRFVLSDEPAAPQRLGWSTWISSTAFPRDADETILRL